MGSSSLPVLYQSCLWATIQTKRHACSKAMWACWGCLAWPTQKESRKYGGRKRWWGRMGKWGGDRWWWDGSRLVSYIWCVMILSKTWKCQSVRWRPSSSSCCRACKVRHLSHSCRSNFRIPSGRDCFGFSEDKLANVNGLTQDARAQRPNGTGICTLEVQEKVPNIFINIYIYIIYL